MNKKKNELGFGGTEVLSVALVCLFLSAIILVIALQSSYKEKYQVMAYNTRILGLDATNYNMNEQGDIIYLSELIDTGIMSNIKNPFYSTKYCDTTSSKVEFIDDKRYITLQCGEYLIHKQYIASKKYQIYKASNWSLRKKEANITETIYKYNYKKNGNNIFKEFYEEKMFLYAFNKQNNTQYQKIKDIPNKYKVYKLKFYRTLRRIAEVEAN